jgi:hypothetical protein
MSSSFTISEYISKNLFRQKDVEDASGLYKYIETSDFINYGKYDEATVYFLHNEKYYAFDVRRCGSYFSDYEYDFDLETLSEVTRKEVIKIEWVYV